MCYAPGAPTRVSDNRPRPSYLRRVWTNAWSNTAGTFRSMRGRVLWGAGVVVAGVILAAVGVSTGAGALTPAVAVSSVAALVALGFAAVAVVFVVNLALAPARLDQDAQARHLALEGQLAGITLSTPRPIVTRPTLYSGVRLDVTNEGVSARFSWEVRFVTVSREGARSGPEPHSSDRFRPAWESGERDVLIPRGGTQSVWLAVRPSRGMGGIEVAFPFTAEYNRGIPFALFWTEAYEVSNDGTRKPLRPGNVVVEVTLLSEPPAAGDVFRRQYVIDGYGNCEDVPLAEA